MARQNLIGLVVSQGKMNKTVKVRVQRKTYDNIVHKEVMTRKDYLVHDEGNVCKEGDIVRIEQIPKMTVKKYFAIADVKLNKGQQFAKYEVLAKQKVADEEKAKIQEFLDRKEEFAKTIEKVEDLKTLDRISKDYENAPEGDRLKLLEEINKLKEKYGLKTWPSTEPVLTTEVVVAARDLSIVENRYTNIKPILNKLMGDEYAEQRSQILTSLGRDPATLAKETQKNILRKYVLNPKNTCPVTL